MKVKNWLWITLILGSLLTACGGSGEQAATAPSIKHELSAQDVQSLFEEDRPPHENVNEARQKMMQSLEKAIKDGKAAGVEEDKLVNLTNAREMLNMEFKRYREMATTEVMSVDGEMSAEHLEMHRRSVNQSLESEVLNLNEQLRLMIEE